MATQISKKRKFIADGVFFAELNEVFMRELSEDGYSGVEVKVTRMRTEIIIRSTRTQNVLMLSDARKKAILYDLGMYDPTEEVDEGFCDFMQEMLSLMTQVREGEKWCSLEELQSMFVELAQGFDSTKWFTSPPCVGYQPRMLFQFTAGKGYLECIKGLNWHNVRVELEAKTKVITVDSGHITDKMDVLITTGFAVDRGHIIDKMDECQTT